ncbi:MAG: hypothetical protein QM757_02265 [Paludibaculum sp.]
MTRPPGGVSLSVFARLSKNQLNQAVLIACLLLAPVYGCECQAPPVPEAVRQSTAVFLGKVIENQELAPSKSGRRRYQLRFSVSRIWKGPKTKELMVYDQTPAGDCGGWGFSLGKEYVVFARNYEVTNQVTVRVEGRNVEWPDPWKGALPIGRQILISEQCTRTAQFGTAAAAEAIQLLGESRQPVPKWQSLNGR